MSDPSGLFSIERGYNPMDSFEGTGPIPAPENDTNPDANSENFSGNSLDGTYDPYAGVSYGVDYSGFGIGNYRDSYTGEGDRIYWGRLDGNDITSINNSGAGSVLHGLGNSSSVGSALIPGFMQMPGRVSTSSAFVPATFCARWLIRAPAARRRF